MNSADFFHHMAMAEIAKADAITIPPLPSCPRKQDYVALVNANMKKMPHFVAAYMGFVEAGVKPERDKVRELAHQHLDVVYDLLEERAKAKA